MVKKEESIFVSVKPLFLVSLEILHSLFLSHQYVSKMKSYAIVYDMTLIFTCLLCFYVATYLSLSSLSFLHKLYKKFVLEPIGMQEKGEHRKCAGHVGLVWVSFLYALQLIPEHP